MLLKQYIKTIKRTQVRIEEIHEFIEFIKNSSLEQILVDAQKIVSDKESIKNINSRKYNIAKTIIILFHVDKHGYIYPYSEKELDKLGLSIYKKFYK
jgi:hypothetical protein